MRDGDAMRGAILMSGGVAKMLGVTRRTIERHAVAGHIPSFRRRPGRTARLYYRYDDIIRWLHSSPPEFIQRQRWEHP